MDQKLIELLLSGAELRVPELDTPLPIDFVAFSDSATLVLHADWWRKTWALGDSVQALHAVPEASDASNVWDFKHGSGALLAPASDEDQQTYLDQMRMRTDLHRPAYLNQLSLLMDDHPEFDFLPWVQAILARPEIDLAATAEGETRERAIGKIMLLDGGQNVVDTLVIDELGNAASLKPDGYMALFVEQWTSYAEGQLPPLSEFVAWLAEQTPYGDRTLSGAGVISASGDVEDIALQLASR